MGFADKIRSNKFITLGLPMIVVLIGGSFGLREFTSVRVTLRDERTRQLSTDEVKKLSNAPKQEFSLDEELQRLGGKIDINNWENKRLPRVGEAPQK